MKIELVNTPEYSLTLTEKEAQALEDIFGNMADRYLRQMLGNSNYSEFVMDFYNLIHKRAE
jgi:translation initiation factor 2 alpha subunit (eIF-2alpha)